MKRILVADDHSIVRKGVIQLLTDEFPGTYFGEACDGAELMKLIRQSHWDLVISDLSMPGGNGLESLKKIKAEFADVRVLIYSMHPETLYAVRALSAGASGYLCKESASEELLTAVRQILSGKRYISPATAEKLADQVGSKASLHLHDDLSDREFEVLKLIASGKTVSQIASELFLSPATISTYRARVLDKTQLKNNAELTRYALEYKLV